MDLDWQDYLEIDPYYYRPNEVESLLGNATKTRKAIGWEPTVDFQGLAQVMVEHDLEIAEREAHAEKFEKRFVI